MLIYDIDDILEVMSESSLDDLFNIYDYQLYFEDGDNKDKSSGEKIGDAFRKIGTPLNDATNYVNTKIAKAFTKPLPKNATQEEKERYEKIINKIKTGLKIGEMVVLYAPITPAGGLFATATFLPAMAKSNDPSDKPAKEAIDKLLDKSKKFTNKFKGFFTKHKNEVVTKDIKQEFDTMSLEGLNIAKEIDATKTRLTTNENNVTESVLIDKFDAYLIDEDGILVENVCEILEYIIENTDYTKYNIFPIVEYYLEMVYEKYNND